MTHNNVSISFASYTEFQENLFALSNHDVLATEIPTKIVSVNVLSMTFGLVSFQT